MMVHTFALPQPFISKRSDFTLFDANKREKYSKHSAVEPSGSERRFYIARNRKPDGSTSSVALLSA